MKNEEIYNIFDTEKFLNRPARVAISNTSGVAGIAHWLNAFYHIPKGQMIEKNHELVVRLKAWVDQMYDNGRVTVITDEELDEQCRAYAVELGIFL